ncbi:hypothetical protein EsH8_V_001173 [Colletotrichum jinshuiense]
MATHAYTTAADQVSIGPACKSPDTITTQLSVFDLIPPRVYIKFIIYLPLQPGLVFKDLSQVLPDFEDLRDAGFEFSAFDDELVLAAPFVPDLSGGVDIFLAQANFVNGGCLLATGFHHSANDATGMVTTMRAWAEHCRNFSQPAGDVCSWLAPESFDRTLLERLWSRTPAKPVSEILRDTWSFLGFQAPDAEDVATEDPAQPPAQNRTMESSIFYISPENFNKLKREVLGETQDGTGLSANDALLALFWRALMKARYKAAIAAGQATPPDEVSHLESPLDGRPDFDPLLPPSYAGNLVIVNKVPMPVVELAAETTSLRDVALRVRAQAAKVNPDLVKDAFTLMREVLDYTKLKHAFTRLDGFDVMITSVLLLPLDKINFGADIFENDGKPESLRPLMDAFNANFRLCMVLPMKTYGGIELLPMLPHSWITGHLSVMFEFRKEYPKDINIGNFHPWIINNYKRYFPDLDHCPSVIYLDLWPIMRSPIVAVYKNTVAAQFTQTKNLDKHQTSLDFMNPLTKGKDIASLQGDEWKKWRSWFNPGFSSRNVSTIVPELIEEIKVFAGNLRQRVGPNGSWGPMFQFRNMTTALTFDIIVRAVLDERLHEQTNPISGPLRIALADQLRLMGIRQAFSFGYLFPWQQKAVDHNNEIIHNQLYPSIMRSLESGLKPSKKKTVLNLALMHLSEEAGTRVVNPATDPDMIETIISNLKTFLVAGHETTASALCFMFKVLQDNPGSLAKVRAEHDEILGPDAEKAANILSNSPQLLNSLRYTHAVIKETLRLYQLASTMRGGEPGFYLTDPDSGRQNSTEGFLVWDGGPGMQHDPSLWPDVEKFVPDRWLVPAEDRLHPVKDTWRAFARGPRDCIGQEVALVEIKLVAALILREFDIEEAWDEWDDYKGLKGPQDMVKGQRLYVAGDGIGHPKDGMPVHVRLRQK